MGQAALPAFEETLNLRPLVPGSSRIFRSANPSGSAASCRVLLSELGIRTVIDLRSDGEVRRDTQGRAFRGVFGGNGVRVDLAARVALAALGSVGLAQLAWAAALLLLLWRPAAARRHLLRHSFLGRAHALAAFYRALLQSSSGAGVARVCAVLARADAFPVLVHCSAGKDRTGVVAALLLRLVGAPDPAIVDDYLRSNAALAAVRPFMADEVARMGLRVDEFVDCREDAIVELLAWIDATYGGVEGYLDSIGVSRSTQAAMRANILGEELQQ
ncbi:protein-tyrosine phosphatase-like protein [Obelidium mucronatum]|nr:protein-tyrosine phosphatase-like protein [Obelidium mucronatum]